MWQRRQCRISSCSEAAHGDAGEVQRMDAEVGHRKISKLRDGLALPSRTTAPPIRSIHSAHMRSGAIC